MDAMTTRTLTKEQQRILDAMEANPALAECIAEMVDFGHYQPMKGRTLDDAEEETIRIIHRSGRVMLQEWCQRSADQATEETLNLPGTRAHEKKSSCSTPPSAPSA